MAEITVKSVRAELKKRMPGYKWTVKDGGWHVTAVGKRSSGFNRTSTLEVDVSGESVTVSAFGFGKKGPCLAESSGDTIAQALRNTQNLLGSEARKLAGVESEMEAGRSAPKAEMSEGELVF